MSEAVVDLLEVVEVQHHHGEALTVAPCDRRGLCNTVVEQDVVRQTGERINEAGTPDLLDEASVVEGRRSDRCQCVEQMKRLLIERKAGGRLSDDQPLDGTIGA